MAKSKSYWEKRSAQLKLAEVRQAKRTTAEIGEIYLEAEREIENEIFRWVLRFSDATGIRTDEFYTALSGKEFLKLKMSLEDYIAKGESLDPVWKQELERASTVHHLSRLQAMRLSIRKVLEDAGGKELGKSMSHFEKVIGEGYLQSVFGIQQGIGVGWNIVKPDTRKVKLILGRPWIDGRTFSDRIWQNKEKLVGIIDKEVTRMVLTGDSPDNAIRKISKALDVHRGQAGRLVMTETAYLSEQAHKEAFKDLGVERYEITATLDLKTSDICQDMDGKVFPMSEFEPGVTAPPFHPWCRSTTVPYFDEKAEEELRKEAGVYSEEKEKTRGGRAARLSDGKTREVPATMTYKTWFDEFVLKDSQELGSYLENRAAKGDKERFKKYGVLFGEEIPKTYPEFLIKRYNDSSWWEDLKARKQTVLNSFDYKPEFRELFGNYEVRSWYVHHNNNLHSLLDWSQTKERIARQAHGLRNMYKKQARWMMADRAEVTRLDRDYPIKDFDFYYRKYGANDAAYDKIIGEASKTNAGVNKKYNLE